MVRISQAKATHPPTAKLQKPPEGISGTSGLREAEPSEGAPARSLSEALSSWEPLYCKPNVPNCKGAPAPCEDARRESATPRESSPDQGVPLWPPRSGLGALAWMARRLQPAARPRAYALGSCPRASELLIIAQMKEVRRRERQGLGLWPRTLKSPRPTQLVTPPKLAATALRLV